MVVGGILVIFSFSSPDNNLRSCGSVFSILCLSALGGNWSQEFFKSCSISKGLKHGGDIDAIINLVMTIRIERVTSTCLFSTA